MLECWNDGMVKWWSLGVMEWWEGEQRRVGCLMYPCSIAVPTPVVARVFRCSTTFSIIPTFHHSNAPSLRCRKPFTILSHASGSAGRC